MLFNKEYYNNNRQDRDRIGLSFYSNLIKYYFKPNTYEFKEELINWDYKGFQKKETLLFF